MTKCLYCHQRFVYQLSLLDIFSLHRHLPPVLCQKCTHSFAKIALKKHCPGCKKVQADETVCQDCLAWQKLYPEQKINHQVLYEYDEAMMLWFKRYKFNGDYQLASCFRLELAKSIKQQHVDIVIPIPLSPLKRQQRGFNQVEALLDACQIDFQSLLVKKYQSRSQSSLNRHERLAIQQPFSLAKQAKKKIIGNRVLLVDDIYTTGRTMFYAYECLREAHPKEVKTLSIAR